jgi:citrate lyase beta subunit
VAAYEGSNGGVTQIEGRLVEAPVIRQYRRILAQAAQEAQSPPAKRSP